MAGDPDMILAGDIGGTSTRLGIISNVGSGFSRTSAVVSGFSRTSTEALASALDASASAMGAGL
jgi:glucokinase